MDLHKIFGGIFGSKHHAQQKDVLPPPKPDKPTKPLPHTNMKPPKPSDTASSEPLPKPPAFLNESNLEKNTQTEFEKPVVKEDKEPQIPALETQSGKATLRAVQELLSDAKTNKQSVEKEIRHHKEKSHPFYLENGQTLYTVDDLRKASQTMSEEIFSHHVKHHKNDFADWIDHALEQPKVAKTIRDVSSPEEMASVLSGDNLLPTISKEPDTKIPPKHESTNELSNIDKHFMYVRKEINQELEKSISSVHKQGERVVSLRKEVDVSGTELEDQEKKLREELQDINTQKQQLEEEVHALKKQNAHLFQTRKQVKQIQQEVQHIYDQLDADYQELLEAREVLKDHVRKQVRRYIDNPKGASTNASDPETQSVYDVLARVQKYIKAGKWEAVRRGYNALRDAFYEDATLSDDQRHELHQEIMDIYTQIHLQEIQ